MKWSIFVTELASFFTLNNKQGEENNLTKKKLAGKTVDSDKYNIIIIRIQSWYDMIRSMATNHWISPTKIIENQAALVSEFCWILNSWNFDKIIIWDIG